MDGMNNRSLDFIETDSSDEEPIDRNIDVSPGSLAASQKPHNSNAGEKGESPERSAIYTASSAIADAFDFGLDVKSENIQDDRESNRAQALASLDPHPSQPHKTYGFTADSSGSDHKHANPYPEMIPYHSDEPRTAAVEERDHAQHSDPHDIFNPTVFSSANMDQLHQEIARHGQSSSDVNEKAMLLGMVLQAILALPDKGKSSRHTKTSRTPGSQRHPKGSKPATTAASTIRALFEPSASVPNLPPIRSLSTSKDQPLPLRPQTVHKDQPQPARPQPPHGILRTPSWGPASARPATGKQRSMSSPEPADMQKSTHPSPPPPIDTNLSTENHLPHAQWLSSSSAAEQHASPSPPLKTTPRTPYPHSATDSPDRSQENNPETGVHQPLSPHVEFVPAPRSASVRIMEPPRHSSPESQLDQTRRNTLASRRRSSVINSAAVSADTILALSVRRRHAPNGRVFVRLIVPADDEIATPAQSRRRSTAAGRKLSIASTDPEKSQEGKDSENVSPKEKHEFDDAAFFRKLREAYYNELLGSSPYSRFFRRYLSTYVLKRITLVSADGVEDPDPPNITPATRSTRFLTLSGFNDVESEDSLLRHFLLPNLGRASWRWVRWVHRVAISVDQDNAEFEARMRKVSVAGPQQRISAVPGGLELIEGPGVGRLMSAVGVTLVASVMATVLHITLGPLGAAEYATEALTDGVIRLGTRDAADRVVQGVLLGQFVMMFGAVTTGMWVVGSRLVM